MQDFINSVTERLGIDQDQAKGAVGSLLAMIRKEDDSGDANELVDKLPGANALADEAEGDGGGGLLGKVGGMLGGLGGGAAGGLAGLASNLPTDKIGDFVKMFVDWAKEKVGPDLVNKVIDKVPALKSIL